ncbi:MAG TPA: substrate-binding domain-containing protein [Myxococcaceae bacterium]|nr:substrate-binding domain-containing protein [Myxococcaceae bacterium]
MKPDVPRATWLLMACVLTACSPEHAEAPLRYEGSPTIAGTLLPDLIQGYERTSGRKFGTVSANGARVGLQALLSGEAQVVGVARYLYPAERAQGLYYEILGYDAVALLVNRRNPVRELDGDELEDVATGRISNWKALGGPDLPIERVRLAEGARASPRHPETPFAPPSRGLVTELDTAEECVRYAEEHPAAVAFVSMTTPPGDLERVTVDGMLPSPETIHSGEYRSFRPLLLVSRQVPRGDLKRFFDFARSHEGRELVARHFLPITGRR